jgi:L-fuculose-phosphate aldolase
MSVVVCPPATSAQADGVVMAARAMLAKGLVVGTVGSVSARVSGGFIVTPTRTTYHEMGSDDLVALDLLGSIHGPALARPSREWPLHCAIYRSRSDVAGIVHTHSVHATAWSFLSEPLQPRLEEARYYGVGPVRTAPPAAAGSHELAENAVGALGRSGAVLLAGHGLVAVGPTVAEALMVAEVVEREAHVAWILRGQL